MHDDQTRDLRGGFDPRRLPEFAPDPRLWARVLAMHQHQRRVRRWRRGGGLAAAALVAGFALWLAVPRPQPMLPSALAVQHESQLLEREWQRLALQHHAAASELARVRVIDATLQAAYDRDASADELAPLWQRRNQVLRGLIAQVQGTADGGLSGVTRI